MKTPKTTLSAGLIVALIAGFILFSAWKSPTISDNYSQDTTKKSAPKKKETKYSRKAITVYDEQGQPQEEITESLEGDEDLKLLFEGDRFKNFEMPPLPNFENFEMPEMPEMPELSELDELRFSIEGFPALDSMDMEGLQQLQEQFKHFNEDFSEQMARNFDGQFQHDMERMQEDLEQMNLDLENDLSEMDENLNKALQGIDESFNSLNDPFAHANERIAAMRKSIAAFEKEAQEELVKDGYLKEDEKIENMNFSDDEIKVNGKTIKPEHKAKYKTIKSKYLKGNKRQGRPE